MFWQGLHAPSLGARKPRLSTFFLGAFAAGFLLYGIALIYGGSSGIIPTQVGSTNLTALGYYLRSAPYVS